MYNSDLRPILSYGKAFFVVGVGGVPEALDLIKKRYMTGTATFDSYQFAKDFYTFVINIINNNNIIADTN